MGSEVNGPMIVVGLDGQNAADIDHFLEFLLEKQ